MDRLEDIEGIGSKTVELLKNLKINSIEDLVTYYPKKYDFLKRSDMNCLNDGDKVIVDGVVEGVPTVVNLSSKLKKIFFRISNCNGIYNVSAYNQVYLCRELYSGVMITVIGKYDKIKNTIVVHEVRRGLLSDKVRIEPVYPSVKGLHRKNISRFIRSALVDRDICLEDYIPLHLQERYHFRDKLWSLREIHNPSDGLSYKRALQRLKYEELFWYLFRINRLKRRIMFDDKAIARNFSDEEVLDFIHSLSFELTVDQVKCVQDISEDMRSKRRMNRLVQGDVGSGKTIVAMIAMYINYLSGYQTALMVPTEILAKQHYHEAIDLFERFGVRICLLTSSVSKRDKDRIYEDISLGKVDFIIGTQSLIQDGLFYYNLGLIITDEQHRFGVNQRESLKNKGSFPDVLSMSATPIPRTYALAVYGDMDVSSIKSKPSGRKEVITYFKKDNSIFEVLKMMKGEIDKGHQVYVIAPSIADEDEKSISNVMKLKEKMELAFGKVCKIGAVHGKMDNDSKENIMNEFERGNISILISTTVIEVGLNVVNASMIVVFQSNMFGLSTLHQLRGRVGRGNIQSYCILLAKEYSERLKMLESCHDGFKISEYDFKNRGEGDLFGNRQSGEIGFKLASLNRDYNMLLRVRDDVLEFMEKGKYKNAYEHYIDMHD